MHHSPSFSVAGMSSSPSSHHNPNLSARGSTGPGVPLTSSFSESMSLSQPRTPYASGYLMSSSQSHNAPQGNQRVDEVPVVQTKAKMNHILSRGTAPDFGMDSMFQSSRQAYTDAEAPPTNTIYDIPNEVASDPSPGRFQTKQSGNEKSYFTSSRRQTNAPQPPAPEASQPIYVIVFGYPPEKYNAALELFKSLGKTTDPEQGVEILNCFRIGYYAAGDALRAVRKNGEILGGSWMIGVKWSDPTQAEVLLGQQGLRSPLASSIPQNQTEFGNHQNNAMAVDEPISPQSNTGGTPTVGTPLRLAPSMSAFRKTPGVSTPKPATPQQAKWGSGLISTPVTTPGQNTSTPNNAIQPSPSKGVMSQMSDMIFGW